MGKQIQILTMREGQEICIIGVNGATSGAIRVFIPKGRDAIPQTETIDYPDEFTGWYE